MIRIVVVENCFELEILKYPLHVKEKNVKDLSKKSDLATIKPVQVHLYLLNSELKEIIMSNFTIAVHVEISSISFYFLDLLVNTGVDCWYKCGEKEGPCEQCGKNGYCCRFRRSDTSGYSGCDGTFGGLRKHECVENSNAGIIS